MSMYDMLLFRYGVNVSQQNFPTKKIQKPNLIRFICHFEVLETGNFSKNESILCTALVKDLSWLPLTVLAADSIQNLLMGFSARRNMKTIYVQCFLLFSTILLLCLNR